MVRFLARRVAWSAGSLLLFVTVTFFGMSLLPYDYASRYGQGCPSCSAEAADRLGLTRPLWDRYADFLGDLFTGSLGVSYSGRPVLAVLTGREMWVTVLIFGFGAVVAVFLGAWLGRLAAWHNSTGVQGMVRRGVRIVRVRAGSVTWGHDTELERGPQPRSLTSMSEKVLSLGWSRDPAGPA